MAFEDSIVVEPLTYWYVVGSVNNNNRNTPLEWRVCAIEGNQFPLHKVINSFSNNVTGAFEAIISYLQINEEEFLIASPEKILTINEKVVEQIPTLIQTPIKKVLDVKKTEEIKLRGILGLFLVAALICGGLMFACYRYIDSSPTFNTDQHEKSEVGKNGF